jgi:hypothetical protein
MYRHLNLIVVIIFFILSVSRVHCSVLLNGQTSLAAASRSFCLPANRRRCLSSRAERRWSAPVYSSHPEDREVLAQQTGTPCSGVLSQANESGLAEKRSQCRAKSDNTD